jgi:hypothetical protein
MLTAKQYFAQLEVLSTTRDPGVFILAEKYIRQVPASEVERLRDKVQKALPPSQFTSNVLDILNALLAQRDG